MGKIEWKPGNMLYPLPVVMVTVADEAGNVKTTFKGNTAKGRLFKEFFVTEGLCRDVLVFGSGVFIKT